MASDCNVELHKNMALVSRFDNASDGNVVQCGEIGGIGADTTFTVALGYGGDTATALAAAEGSLAAGSPDRETAYRKGWSDYVGGLRPAPSSVPSDMRRRRVYYTATMALHAAEDKTFHGANVAGFGTPWGDFLNGDLPNDGYHRVWGRDLYQQAMGLIAAGNSGQAFRMAQFLWSTQFVGTMTPGDGMTYQPGSFPRYTPVSGIGAATAKDLGCCEQLDEEAFAILLAWMTGLSDSSTYHKIRTTADHIAGVDRRRRSAGRSNSVNLLPRSPRSSPGWSRPRTSRGRTTIPPAQPAGNRRSTRGVRASPIGRARSMDIGAIIVTLNASIRRKIRTVLRRSTLTRATS